MYANELYPILFVICLHNYEYFEGLRANSAMYSAHPEERQILLAEGLAVSVIGVEEIYIDNSSSDDAFWKDFNEETVNVIYLFNSTF